MMMMWIMWIMCLNGNENWRIKLERFLSFFLSLLGLIVVEILRIEIIKIDMLIILPVVGYDAWIGSYCIILL